MYKIIILPMLIGCRVFGVSDSTKRYPEGKPPYISSVLEPTAKEVYPNPDSGFDFIEEYQETKKEYQETKKECDELDRKFCFPIAVYIGARDHFEKTRKAILGVDYLDEDETKCIFSKNSLGFLNKIENEIKRIYKIENEIEYKIQNEIKHKIKDQIKPIYKIQNEIEYILSKNSPEFLRLYDDAFSNFISAYNELEKYFPDTSPEFIENKIAICERFLKAKEALEEKLIKISTSDELKEHYPDTLKDEIKHKIEDQIRRIYKIEDQIKLILSKNLPDFSGLYNDAFSNFISAYNELEKHFSDVLSESIKDLQIAIYERFLKAKEALEEKLIKISTSDELKEHYPDTLPESIIYQEAKKGYDKLGYLSYPYLAAYIEARDHFEKTRKAILGADYLDKDEIEYILSKNSPEFLRLYDDASSNFISAYNELEKYYPDTSPEFIKNQIAIYERFLEAKNALEEKLIKALEEKQPIKISKSDV